MARTRFRLPPRTDLDSIVDAVRLKLSFIEKSRCALPSRIVQRRIVEKLTRDELWRRVVGDRAKGFAQMLDRLLSPDPFAPEIICDALWWQKRMVTAQMVYEIDHLPELLAEATRVTSAAAWAELNGS